MQQKVLLQFGALTGILLSACGDIAPLGSVHASGGTTSASGGQPIAGGSGRTSVAGQPSSPEGGDSGDSGQFGDGGALSSGGNAPASSGAGAESQGGKLVAGAAGALTGGGAAGSAGANFAAGNGPLGGAAGWAGTMGGAGGLSGGAMSGGGMSGGASGGGASSGATADAGSAGAAGPNDCAPKELLKGGEFNGLALWGSTNVEISGDSSNTYARLKGGSVGDTQLYQSLEVPPSVNELTIACSTRLSTSKSSAVEVAFLDLENQSAEFVSVQVWEEITSPGWQELKKVVSLSSIKKPIFLRFWLDASDPTLTLDVDHCSVTALVCPD